MKEPAKEKDSEMLSAPEETRPLAPSASNKQKRDRQGTGDNLIGLEPFFMLSLDLLCIIDFDGHFKRLNPVWETTLGYTQSELLSKSYLEFVHSGDRATTLAQVQKLMGGTSTVEFENRYRSQDGTYRQLIWKVTACSQQQLLYCVVRDISENNKMNVVGATGTATDITQHKQAEKALITERKWAEVALRKKTEALASFSRSLKHLHQINTTNYKDFETLFADCLETGRAILGLSTGIISQIVEHNYLICSVRSNLEFFAAQMQFELNNTYCAAVVREKRTIAYSQVGAIPGMQDHRVYQTLKLESYIGTPIWVNGEIYGTLNFSSTAVRSIDFQPHERELVELMAQSIGRFLAAEQADKKRQRAEESLRESEERWQLALKGTNDGIWDWNVKTNEVFYSTRWKKMLGYEESEIPDHLDEWAQRVHPNDLERTMQLVQEHFEQKTPFYVNEHRLRCQDGTYKWILSRGQALWDEQGTVVRMAGSHTDITEQKHFEQELQRQRQQRDLLAEVSLKIRQSLQLDTILQTTVTEVQKLLQADRVLILRVGTQGVVQVVKEAVGSNWTAVIGQGIVDDCLELEYFQKYPKGRVYNLPNVEKADVEDCLVEFLHQFQVKSKLSIPVLLKEKLWGMIIIHQCSHVREWSDIEIRLVQQLANQVSIALAQSHLVETLQVQARQQAVVAELGQYALVAPNLDCLFNQAAIALACTLEMEYCNILELLPNNQALLLRAGVGWQAGLLGQATESAMLDSQAGYTLLSSEPVIIDDLSTEKRFRHSSLLHSHGVKSGASFAIRSHKSTFGVLGVYTAQQRKFSADDINFIRAVANVLSAAIEKKRVETALQNSERRYSTLAKAAPVAIFRTDNQGNCIYVNDCWLNLAGLTWQETVGQGWVQAIHPEDRDRVADEWTRSVQANLPFSAEYRFMRPDGVITWVYGQAVSEKAEDGGITGYVGTLTNITERLKVEEMRRALEREKELSELKLRFFSMASHEFRTPLSVALFAAQVLENSEPEWLDDKKLRNLHRIQDSIKQITQMLTDVLAIARAEAQQLEFNPKPLNLQQFCDQIREEIETSQLSDPSIQFIYQGARDNVCLDKKLLHSILINLLSNAVKYSPQGSKVEFRVILQPESVVFVVKDRGIGISLEDREHLFEAFQRGKNVGKIEGSGLGLAVVKKYVDLHGGQIEFESSLGKGTTFTVQIPIGSSN